MNIEIPEGYILLARKIRKSPLWRSLKATHRIVMIELLLQAQFRDGEVVRNGEIIHLKRGQIATSYQQLVDDIGDKEITVKVVRNAINKLVKHGFLAKDEAKSRAKKGLLLTIVNYDIYQNPDNYKGKDLGKEMGNERAKQGQSKGKARAINNNDNNVNNDKNDKNDVVDIEGDPINLYLQHFITISETQKQILIDWVTNFGNAEIICYAIKKTADKNPLKPFSYLESILTNWYRQRLFTMEQVIESEKRFEKKNKVKPIRKSLFDQGEESRRRQARAEKEAELIDDEELKRMVEEMPY